MKPFPLLFALLVLSLPLYAEDLPVFWIAGVSKDASETTTVRIYQSKEESIPVNVEKVPGITMAEVQKAEMVERGDRPTVGVTLTGDGQVKLAEMTKKYLNREVAIGTGNAVLLVPTIKDIITNGQIAISGNLTVESAQTLVDSINKK